MGNDAEWTQGGVSGQAHHEMASRYASFTDAQDKWEAAANKYGNNSRQAKAAWDAQMEAWNSYKAAGGRSSLGPPQSGRRSAPGARAGGRRSSDPSGGSFPGPKSPPVDQ